MKMIKLHALIAKAGENIDEFVVYSKTIYINSDLIESLSSEKDIELFGNYTKVAMVSNSSFRVTEPVEEILRRMESKE